MSTNQCGISGGITKDLSKWKDLKELPSPLPEKFKNKKFIILQPSTWERNLGGICYTPYWTYAAMRLYGIDVEIKEDFTVRDFDELELSLDNIYLIDYSSQAQQELAKVLYYELNQMGFENTYFIGYRPFISQGRYPYFELEDELGIDLREGVWNFIFYNDEYKFGLLSDCDSHIKSNDNRRVVPIFLAVGCKRGCEYCYVSSEKYIFGMSEWEITKKQLDYCIENDLNIHFCDENFYYNKDLDKILEYLKNNPGKSGTLKWICLTDSLMLSKTIERLGANYLKECGCSLNEIGLEVMDENSDKNISDKVIKKKQNVDMVLESGLNVFWLTVACFPGDTLNQHNRLGAWLKDHGQKRENILDRIVTNSTEAGLGQFFQAYPGIPMWDYYEKEGEVIVQQSMRLRPSYLPNSILDAEILFKREVTDEDKSWFHFYITNKDIDIFLSAIKNGKNVRDLFNEFGEDIVILILQMARLNILTEKLGK